YVKHLGGADNLVKVDNCATRLRLDVVDSSLIDEKELKKLGAKGVMKLNKTTAQVIVGTKVEFVAEGIKAVLKK
ncbi:MAG: glucose PTS transporter subunit EIIB, partial [Culicoidibacterales bacterium]